MMAIRRFPTIVPALFAVMSLSGVCLADSSVGGAWSATINVEGQQIGSAVYQFQLTLGVDADSSRLPLFPPPPEYTAFMKLWDAYDWTGPWYADIRQYGDTLSRWVIEVDPRGNVPPPGERSATLSWDPAEFAPPGSFLLREGFVHDGPILVPDMCDISSMQIVSDGPLYFVLQYVECGDADASGRLNMSDVVFLVSWIFGGGGSPLVDSVCNVDCSDTINMSDIIYLIQYFFADGPAPCDPNADGAFDCLSCVR